MRLQTRKQYKRMAHGSLKYSGRWILADLRLTAEMNARLGITVTRRFGGAVQRNRFKRIVREAFRLSRSQIHYSFDILIRPRTLAKEAHTCDVQEELLSFIAQASNSLNKI